MRTLCRLRKLSVRLSSRMVTPHKIEVLGNGQQVVVAGISPRYRGRIPGRGAISGKHAARRYSPLSPSIEVRESYQRFVQRLEDELGRDGALTRGRHSSLRAAARRAFKADRVQGARTVSTKPFSISRSIRLSEGVVIEDIIKECVEVVRLAWSKLPDDHPEKETVGLEYAAFSD